MYAPFGQADVAVGQLVFLFVLFSCKHVLADFVWQPHWMAVGKEQADGWFRPLVMHCLVHGACTTMLVLLFQPRLWLLGPVDFAIHIVIDRCKGFMISRNRWIANDRPFWTLLGIDQTLHHLTGFMLALVMAASFR